MNLSGALRGRLDGVSDVWRGDHPWATLYDFMVEHERIGGTLWKVGGGTDLGLLYDAADEVAGLPAGSAVLDVPCGGGVALRGLRRDQDVRYVAADISPAMLRRTARNAERRGLGQVQFVEADVEHLPFADETFDLVVSFTGLHCFPRPALAVAECARVLKPGGRIRIATPDYDTMIRLAVGPLDPEAQALIEDANRRNGMAEDQLGEAIFVVNRMFSGHGHRFLYSEQLLTRCLETAGLTDVQRHIAGETDDAEFAGIDKHGNQIGADWNRYHTLAVEAVKPS